MEFNTARYDFAKIRQLPLREQVLFANAVKKLRGVRVPSFAEFFEKTTSYKIEQWQKVLAARCELLTKQQAQKLKIHKPPQHGGSIVVSQRLAPYYIGCNPNARVRLLTYNITHSERFSNTIIRIMQSAEYKQMFPSPDCHIPNNVRAGEWSTNLRKSMNDSQPSFMALGLHSGFVGSGGDLIIVDDPYANDREPFSDTINDALWKTHNEVIIPRMNPETNIVVMYHSWNDNDYGSKLDQQGGWESMKFSAICEDENDLCGREIGEALSDRYPINYLETLRDGGTLPNGSTTDGIGTSAFSSLYQGNAKPRGGTRFKEWMFKYVDDFKREEESFFVRSWDLASSEEKSADRTAGTLLYKTPSGIYTVINHKADRLSSSKRDDYILATCRNDNERYGKIAPVFTYIEYQFGIASEVVDGIIRLCAQYGVRANRVSKDKVSRTEPLLAQMERGNVQFLNDTPEEKWNFDLEQEMLSFPNGKHDDRVDSLSSAFNIAVSLNFL